MKFFLPFAALLLAGCVNGPVRYKTFGYRQYLTAAICAGERPINPLLLPPAALADTIVVVQDTVAVPIWAGVDLHHYLMNEGRGIRPREIPLYIVAFPIWYGLGGLPGALHLTFAPEEEYASDLGLSPQPIFGESHPSAEAAP